MSMTDRAAAVLTYQALLSQALRVHVELNPGSYERVSDLDPTFVADKLAELTGSNDSPYMHVLDEIDARGSRAWTRFAREIVRGVERTHRIRPNYFAHAA